MSSPPPPNVCYDGAEWALKCKQAISTLYTYMYVTDRHHFPWSSVSGLVSARDVNPLPNYTLSRPRDDITG